MTEKSSRFIGNIPENYDTYLGPNIFNYFAADLGRRAAALNPRTVLELAAGTGIASRYLRDALAPDASLTVTDLNAPMLDVAAQKFSDGEAVKFVPADAMALPFDDGSFDLLVCQFGVMFFPDVVASYKESARVLRSGGHYMFSTWGSQAENPFSQIAHDAIAEFFPDKPPGFYRVPFIYHDPDIVREDLRASGLTDVDHVEVRQERVVTDLAGFARGLVFGNPVIEEILGRGGDADAVMQRVHQRLSERLGAEPATMPLKITVFTVCVA